MNRSLNMLTHDQVKQQCLDLKELGMALAYKHTIPFLKSKGGLVPVEELYGFIAIKGLIAGQITVSQIRKKDYWKHFTQGIARVNPTVWSNRQQHAYGDPLEIVCGEPTPKGYWALKSYYDKSGGGAIHRAD